MANKYGKNGEAVAAFLDEVSATDLAGWRAFLELESSSDELIAAVRALNAAPLSASARSAVYGAAQKTFRGLGLGDSGLGKGTSIIYDRVDTAATGLAVRDALSPEQLQVILAPFVALGFRSVADATPAPTDQ
jgi:hypothetical protein